MIRIGLGWGTTLAMKFCLSLFPFIFLYGCKSEERFKTDGTTELNWKKIGPGGGGSTFIPTFSYDTPDKFLVRCDMTGTYITSNGGESYNQVNFANGASCFAYDPHNLNTIYIGSASLNKSTDGGKTWQRIFPKDTDIVAETFQGDHATFSIKTTDSSLYIKGSRIGSVCVDPVNSASLYFSMGPYFFYSNDSGNVWHRKELNAPVDFIYSNSTSLKEKVFIFTSKSVFVLNKSTGTFNQKDLPLAMTPAFSFTGGTLKQGDDIIFYALHQDTNETIQEEFGHTELWISDDAGEHWLQVENNIITNKSMGVKPSYSMIACAEFDAANAYVVCNRYEENNNVNWYGALKTNDGGRNWNWVWKGGGGSGQYGVKDGAGVSNLRDAWVEKAFGGEYIRLLDVGVFPNDGDVAVVTDWYRTMKTTDGGKTWNEIYSITNPGGTFTSRGMDVTTSYGVHHDPFDTSHIAISYTDIGYHHSYNGGKSWSRSMNGVPAEWQNTCYWVQFDPNIKDKVWSAWSNLHDFPRGKMTRNPQWKEKARGGICVSMDGGKTWKVSNEGMGNDSPITSIVIDPNSKPGNRTLYACVFNKGVFKSTDDGKTWTLKDKGIDSNTRAFELAIQSNSTLFLIVTPAPDYRENKFQPGALYKSTDGAETWTKLDIGNILFPNGVGIDPESPDRIYLACWSDIMLRDLIRNDQVDRNTMLNTDGGIFLSEDGGKTWKSIFDKDQYVYDVTVDPYHKGRIYCNTFNKGAFRSDDYGKSWKKLKDYDFHWGHRVIIDENDHDKVYLTTFGSSVWHGKPEVE